MKHLSFFLLGFIFFNVIKASEHKPTLTYVSIQSQESNLNNNHTVSINFKIKFLDTVFFDYSLELIKQTYYYEEATQNQGSSDSWWNSSTAEKPDTGTYLPSDSIEGTLEFIYNPNYLPHSFRSVFFVIKDSAGEVMSQTMAYIYFTTYGTIEVWNEYDFDALKRSWDSPEQGFIYRSVTSWLETEPIQYDNSHLAYINAITNI
jgi:hypothetical protein